MPKYLILALLAFSFAAGAVVTNWKYRAETVPVPPAPYARPPRSIVICGIKDHPCVSYAVSYHPPSEKYGDGPGEGFTDYQAKTISIASSKDRFKDVQALEHEVYHAALSERGFEDTEQWDLHAWIYFSEGPFSMVLHDNPDFVRYLLNGY
jgi:hypothetical protein